MGMIPEQFDDPALKAALSQRFSSERAPEALRQRILRLVEETGGQADEAEVIGKITPERARQQPARTQSAGPADAPRSLSLWRRGPFRLAAAVLALGLIGAILFSMMNRDGRRAKTTPMLPQLVAGMISTHDYCCTHENHKHPEIEQNDFARMRQQVEQRLNHPVVAAALEGWQFKGCYICPVGDARSAHLMYTRGPDQLSIFSFAAEDADDEETSKEVDGHLVAAKIQKGVAVGIVTLPGQHKMGVRDVEQLLRRHEGAIAAARRIASVLASHPVHVP